MELFSPTYILKNLIDTCNIDILELLKLDQVQLVQTIPCPVKFEMKGKVVEFEEPSPCVYCASIDAGTPMAFFGGLLNDGDYIEIEYIQEWYQGYTLLHLAVMAEARECVRVLTTLLADESLVNTVSEDGLLPLTIAIEKENMDIILHLLEGGANPFLGAPCPLQIALEHASVPIVDGMLVWVMENEMQEFVSWVNEMPKEFWDGIGNPDIVERVQAFITEEEEEEGEELRCQLCQNYDIRKCHICSCWYCPVHMRYHRHRIKHTL